MASVTQKNYDDAKALKDSMKAENGGVCFAPQGSPCDETHCECYQIAFDAVMAAPSPTPKGPMDE